MKSPGKDNAIERLVYDRSTQALSVWFYGGRRYDLHDITTEVYELLSGRSQVGNERTPEAVSNLLMFGSRTH